MGNNDMDSGFNNAYYYIISSDFLKNFSRNPLSEFLLITKIGLFPEAKYHFCVRNEGLDEAVLIYCREGYGFYSVNNGENRMVNPGQLLIIPPGVSHTYHASYNNPWTIFWMHVKGSFFDTFNKNWQPVSTERAPVGKSIHPELITVSDMIGERIKGIFYQCFHILKMPYQWEEFFYLCQLAATVISLIPNASKRSVHRITESGNRGIETAISYMMNHLHENITLAEVANAACFSPSHLHHLFRESSGHAPVEYFLRMKIQAAAKDIFFSNLSIRKIGESYGISDPYYFSRLFKKVMGLSPLQYRKKLQEHYTSPEQELTAGS